MVTTETAVIHVIIKLPSCQTALDPQSISPLITAAMTGAVWCVSLLGTDLKVWITTVMQVTRGSLPWQHAMIAERGRPIATSVARFGAASRATAGVHH
jgi:hypothetical protein